MQRNERIVESPYARLKHSNIERGCSEPAALAGLNRGQPTAYAIGGQKRALDIVLASILLISLLPLMTAVFILVRLTSPGPGLFLQTRYGYDLRPFTLFKFRTMKLNSAADTSQATKSDQRVTPLGRFLRKMSIDELPQLWNVIRGDMSLVGPRPHPLPLDQKFSRVIPNYIWRYRVRPGITGLAQISGSRGETPSVESMARRVEFDLVYIGRASLARDLTILLGTAKEMFFSRTAF